jgi:hypothetical protein
MDTDVGIAVGRATTIHGVATVNANPASRSAEVIVGLLPRSRWYLHPMRPYDKSTGQGA